MGCPENYRNEYGDTTGVVYNDGTKKCEMCQDDKDIRCTRCTVNGQGKCDSSSCQAKEASLSVVFNNETKMCDKCQSQMYTSGTWNIGTWNIYCKSCDINGGDRCDSSGCPSIMEKPLHLFT